MHMLVWTMEHKNGSAQTFITHWCRMCGKHTDSYERWGKPELRILSYWMSRPVSAVKTHPWRRKQLASGERSNGKSKPSWCMCHCYWISILGSSVNTLNRERAVPCPNNHGSSNVSPSIIFHFLPNWHVYCNIIIHYFSSTLFIKALSSHHLLSPSSKYMLLLLFPDNGSCMCYQRSWKARNTTLTLQTLILLFMI